MSLLSYGIPAKTTKTSTSLSGGMTAVDITNGNQMMILSFCQITHRKSQMDFTA